METSTGNSHSNRKQSSEHSKSANEQKRTTEKEAKTPVFVNYAAIAWHDSRKKWVGDQRVQRMAKDPIIRFVKNMLQCLTDGDLNDRVCIAFFWNERWSTSYEDLLSTNESFPEPIPLTEMVDFLVDIWHDEGLFD